jgi:hypothetical protein
MSEDIFKDIKDTHWTLKKFNVRVWSQADITTTVEISKETILPRSENDDDFHVF